MSKYNNALNRLTNEVDSNIQICRDEIKYVKQKIKSNRYHKTRSLKPSRIVLDNELKLLRT